MGPVNYPKRLHFLSRQINGAWVSKCLEFNLFTHSLSYKMSMYTLLNMCALHLETHVCSTYLESCNKGSSPSPQLYNRAPPWDWVVFYAVTLLNQVKIRPRHIKTVTIHDPLGARDESAT